MFNLIETVINNALKMDPRTPVRLATLDDKILKVEVSDLSLTLYVIFSNSGISISKLSLINSHTTIKGPLNAFITLAIHKDPRLAVQKGLTIEGDTTVGETIQTLFFTLELEWEELISQWTGDTVAHLIGKFFRNTQKLNKKFMASLNYNSSEYLKEELKIVPTQEEVDDFLMAVDKLRTDIDRTEARFNHLEKTILQKNHGVPNRNFDLT